MGVAVVTDSTADIPADVAEARDLRVVPMTVTFGDESFVAGVTMTTDRFYERMAAGGELPTTSQPNPGWFEEAYADADDDGADAVVSIHLSSELSGTCDLARTVARDAPLPVTVVDSRQTSGALALAVFAALRAAERGASADEVAEAARRTAAGARLYFAVDSLEHLKRGGRLSGPQAVVGTVLKVKPILTIEDGRVAPLEKVRTWSRAIDRLGELAGATQAGQRADVIVSHGLVPERATQMWRRVEERLDVRHRMETVIGPVIASHVGAGAVGVAVAPPHG